MAAKAGTRTSFPLANELSASEQSLALCHDRVQAMVYVVGHPNASVAQAVNLCDALIVPVTGDRWSTACWPTTRIMPAPRCPAALIRVTRNRSVPFGVKATVVASTRLSPTLPTFLVKTVFENLDDFKKQHPAFANLEAADMIKATAGAIARWGAALLSRKRLVVSQRQTAKAVSSFPGR